MVIRIMDCGDFMEDFDLIDVLDKREGSFYEDSLNMDTVENILKYSCQVANFKEVSKMYREVSYDQIAYWSEDSHSPIYDHPEKYSELDIENLTFLQKKISTAIDLYTQMLVQGNHFDRKYLEDQLGRL